MKFLCAGSFACIVPFLAAISVANPLRYEIHERSAPHFLRPVKRLEHDTAIPIKIFLKQQGTAEGASHLLDIADPSSPNYAQHWTPEQVTEFFEADHNAVRSVQDWLGDCGIEWDRVKYSRNRGIIGFSATVAEADHLLRTETHQYYNSKSGLYSRDFGKYSLPAHLRDAIEFVTSNSPETVARRSTDAVDSRVKPIIRPYVPASSSGLSNCSNEVTPQCIAALYKIPPSSGPVQGGNSMGIYNAFDKYAQEDLNRFFTKYSLGIPNGTSPIEVGINGSPVGTDDVDDEGAGEAMLDYSMALPIVYPQNITAYVDNDAFIPRLEEGQRGFEAFLDAIDESFCRATGAASNTSSDCGKYKPTNVISVSYGILEYEIDYKYAQRTCNELMKLGLQGITVLMASGDTGVNGNQCSPNHAFGPFWLGACPWVLSVGGTQLPPGADVTASNVEVTWVGEPPNLVDSSGGGFSNYYPMPDYQNSTVNNYLANTQLNFSSYAQFVNESSKNASGIGDGKGLFNRLGRAYPDVSGLAQNVSIAYDGGFILSGGTSAATPIWGAIITRINEERLRAGKNTVGFINPTLYQNPGLMNDVTVGNNGRTSGTCIQGFPATEGWDPVTGLGTPNYEKLLELFLNLP